MVSEEALIQSNQPPWSTPLTVLIPGMPPPSPTRSTGRMEEPWAVRSVVMGLSGGYRLHLPFYLVLSATKLIVLLVCFYLDTCMPFPHWQMILKENKGILFVVVSKSKRLVLAQDTQRSSCQHKGDLFSPEVKGQRIRAKDR